MSESTKNYKLDDAPSARHAILRIADAIEDAPYELASAKVVDVQLAASCSQDFENPDASQAVPEKQRGEIRPRAALLTRS